MTGRTALIALLACALLGGCAVRDTASPTQPLEVYSPRGIHTHY